jgi:hypothetical protein
MKKILLFSLIASIINHHCIGMFMVMRAIKNKRIRKYRCYSNIDEKYEKIAKDIINNPVYRSRRAILWKELPKNNSHSKIFKEQNESSSTNTLQEQTLQAFYTQQTIDIATSSSWYSGWQNNP